MTEATGKIRKFWDDRSTLGRAAGTNDLIHSQIERDFLTEIIPNGSRVLDLGCGNGTTIIELANKNNCSGVAVDFSSGMVNSTKLAVIEEGLENIIEVSQHKLPPAPITFGIFDVVYSQRSLINLESVEDQKVAIHSIANILKLGGCYIMIESSLNGVRKTNELRAELCLEPIDPPWHNLFFDEQEVSQWSTKNFLLEDLVHITSTYNFLSRVVYAKIAADEGEKLSYDSKLNVLAAKLPRSIGDYGPVKAWIWRKKSN